MAHLIGKYVSAEKLGGGAVIGKLLDGDVFIVEERSGKKHLCKTLYAEVQIFGRW